MPAKNLYKKRRDREDRHIDEIVDSVDKDTHPHLGACCLGCQWFYRLCSVLNCILECFSCCLAKAK